MDIEKIIQQMTLAEKADFCSGSDFWHTQPVERLGVPAVMMSDGPSGLRKQDEQGDHLGINESIPAVCFPSSAAVASSFDTALAEKLGNTHLVQPPFKRHARVRAHRAEIHRRKAVARILHHAPAHDGVTGVDAQNSHAAFPFRHYSYYSFLL